MVNSVVHFFFPLVWPQQVSFPFLKCTKSFLQFFPPMHTLFLGVFGDPCCATAVMHRALGDSPIVKFQVW